MEYQINNICLSYKITGFGPPLILLHGWQMRKETFDSLARDLKNEFTVYQIDLPNFGLSKAEQALSLEEYVEVLHQFVVAKISRTPHLLGHSFGGRIAALYAAKYPVNKLILVATPGIKKPLNFYRKFKQYLYKKCHFQLGSKDYRMANDILKKTLVKAVNFDLSHYLTFIDAKTLLLWGKKDREVKVDIGKEMHKKITNSELVVIPNCKHFPYLERYRYFLIVVRYFLLEYK